MRHRHSRLGLLTPVLMVALIGCSAETGAPLASEPTPTVKPTAKPTPTPEPTPEPTPTPKPIPVEIVSHTKNASPNESASVTAETVKGATCTIVVLYESGPSQASGLKEKDVDADGRVVWKWTVGSNANQQDVPITVTCTKGDRVGVAETTFTVK